MLMISPVGCTIFFSLVVMNSLEILQRHKEAKDAGIISNDDFIKIYTDIIVNGAGSRNSSNSSSSSFTPPPLLPTPVLLNRSNKRKSATFNNDQQQGQLLTNADHIAV